MRFVHKVLKCPGRAVQWHIYPIGDVHIGTRNCAETPLRRVVQEIKDNPFAIWFGGGDLGDCIKPQDIKRFGYEILPDWILAPHIKKFIKAVRLQKDTDTDTKLQRKYADEVRRNLSDLCALQRKRLVAIFKPIKNKCLGLIRGNHEDTIGKHYNESHHEMLCEALGVEDLTDETYMRLQFKTETYTQTIFLYARHGYGGGRSAGAEPNKLAEILKEWEQPDIVLTGHTHTFHALPPKPSLYLPSKGALPDEFHCRYRYAFNWGCWLYSHSSGPGTYASKACYPARPLVTAKVVVTPFYHTTRNLKDWAEPKIELRIIPL